MSSVAYDASDAELEWAEFEASMGIEEDGLEGGTQEIIVIKNDHIESGPPGNRHAAGPRRTLETGETMKDGSSGQQQKREDRKGWGRRWRSVEWDGR